MHAAIGVVALVGLIAFAFGERTARAVVGTALIAVALAFAYIMYLIVTNQI